MRKYLSGSLLLLLLLFRISVSAFAAEAAGADIPVVIDGGGTAYMIPEVNSPLPTDNAIRVDNGRTGHFYINFTEPGEYHYTITARFSDADGERDADETFRLTVTVYEREDGVLYTVAVINSNQNEGKPDLVRFRETPEPSTEPPTEPSTEPPTTPPPPGPPGTPRTGDESHLTRYVLAAMMASAGLFGLALLYTVNTDKLIKKERL